MATETNVVCDVYTANPRLKLDDVQEVEINLYVDKEDVFSHTGVMCAKARERLLSGVKRLLKPPAKREKGSDA